MRQWDHDPHLDRLKDFHHGFDSHSNAPWRDDVLVVGYRLDYLVHGFVQAHASLHVVFVGTLLGLLRH